MSVSDLVEEGGVHTEVTGEKARQGVQLLLVEVYVPCQIGPAEQQPILFMLLHHSACVYTVHCMYIVHVYTLDVA